MNRQEFALATQKYVDELSGFIKSNRLPMRWFKAADHVAVKARDSEDFERLLELFRPDARQMTCVDMDGRRLATATLKTPLPVGQFGAVSWLEIMEPRPEKVGKDVVGFEHMEFYYSGFARITTILDKQGIAYELEHNPYHKWLTLKINDKGQELKLNDSTLAENVAKELKEGAAYLI